MPTSQIIVTSRFIRSGTKKAKSRRENYTKYIATRESVEKRPQSNTAVTANQTQLINELLKEFTIAKTYLEYEDYSAKPTAENASELISTIIERHAEVIGEYIAPTCTPRPLKLNSCVGADEHFRRIK
ncbi:hypothetical protein SAMN02910317_03241 [Ruminococcaceae bacterium FB2012]|nr:hypothetical protein SAMN02910317_03241 [Ruminococcaceae bacterium FB2012]